MSHGIRVGPVDGTAVPSRPCSKAVHKPIWRIPLLSVQWINSWWWKEELPETCRVSCQNKFVKLVHLFGFIIKKFVTKHGHTTVKLVPCLFLKVIQYLFTSSSSSFLQFYPSIFPWITCFRRQFLRNIWPIHLAFRPFIVCREFLSSLTLCNISSFLSRSVQLIFFILSHHRISEISRYSWPTFRRVHFPAPTKLCSKCSSLLVSSLNLSVICWWKESSC